MCIRDSCEVKGIQGGVSPEEGTFIFRGGKYYTVNSEGKEDAFYAVYATGGAKVIIEDGDFYGPIKRTGLDIGGTSCVVSGDNDTGMEVADFISNYTALVQAIQESYPYTDIIVNTVPPVPANHANYPNMDQTKIDDFNMALLNMCEQLGLKFLNTAETLKGDDGYGKADYYTSGDIHLKSAGLKAALNYLRTHACETTDNRPDTNNIPIRTLEYVSNPSSAVQAPSSEAASESTSSSVEAVHYEALSLIHISEPTRP